MAYSTLLELPQYQLAETFDPSYRSTNLKCIERYAARKKREKKTKENWKSTLSYNVLPVRIRILAVQISFVDL